MNGSCSVPCRQASLTRIWCAARGFTTRSRFLGQMQRTLGWRSSGGMVMKSVNSRLSGSCDVRHRRCGESRRMGRAVYSSATRHHDPGECSSGQRKLGAAQGLGAAFLPFRMRVRTLHCKVRTRVLVGCGRRGGTPSEMGGRHEEVVETHPWRDWDGIDLGSSLERRWHDHDAGVSAGNR